MLPISEIWRISDSVNSKWQSPVADAAAEAWGLPRGSALWLRSSSTHVFIVPASHLAEGALFLRFAPARSAQGSKLAPSAELMAGWSERGLGAVKPLPSLRGQLTETVPTAHGLMVAMLVPAAVGVEITVEELTMERAAAWGESLGRLHQEGCTGLPVPEARPEEDAAEVDAGQEETAGPGPARSEDPLTHVIRELTDAMGQQDPAAHSRGMCHGDFELDNLRFGPDGPVFFDTDEAHEGWFAGDVALAVRDLTGVTPDSAMRPALLDAFLSGYRAIRTFTEEEEQTLPLHSLAASARLVLSLENVLDAGGRGDEPGWVQDLHSSIKRQQRWHRERLLRAQIRPA
ncbi:phosphotransferase [Arthrobacter oryzae]|uniref:phosphotransferase enzyme family protein n=1 Tax=Arthrobacter oryzae TaxID=409290 RepID=UPI00286769A6|nr:phosphotransferase [Arthrobacter oryzae]MDR6507993.1 Ser/Thr protein kinase RdoA (MazF antagonist) [Arthrobacter oryzae]